MRYSWDSSMCAWSFVVQVASRREVVPERLLDDDPRFLGQTCIRRPLTTMPNSEGGISR